VGFAGTQSVAGKVLDVPFGPLGDVVEQNPDFLLQIAMGYLAHLEAPLPQTQPAVEEDGGEEGGGGGGGVGAALGGGRTGATTLGYGFGGGPVQQNNASKNKPTAAAASTRAFGAGGRAGMTIQSVTAGMMTLSGGAHTHIYIYIYRLL
jgi:hypothetical protein